MRDAKRAAEYLFDEIGGIDDKYIAAAQSVRRQSNFSFRRIAALAAAVVAVFMLATVSLPYLTRNSEKIADDAGNSITASGQENADQSSGAYLNAPLEQLLSQTGDSFATDVDVDLFDGRAKLIWQDRQSGDVSMILLSQSELTQIKKMIGNGVRTERDSTQLLVWISYGNGQVVSPYLEKSDGNMGYGSLFDYLPEIDPTDEFASYIGTIIAQHT